MNLRTSTCKKCHHQNPPDSHYCESCGQAVTNLVARERQANQVEADLMLAQAKGARKAFAVILVVGALGALLQVSMSPSALETAIYIGVELVIYAALWFWAGRRPLAAGISGLTYFVLTQVLILVFEPRAAFGGLIVKIIVVSMLIQAIRAGLRHRTFVQQHGID